MVSFTIIIESSGEKTYLGICDKVRLKPIDFSTKTSNNFDSFDKHIYSLNVPESRNDKGNRGPDQTTITHMVVHAFIVRIQQNVFLNRRNALTRKLEWK